MIRDNKKQRVLLVTALKDKNKLFLKKPLIVISEGCLKYLDKDFENSDLTILNNYWKKKNPNNDFKYIYRTYLSYLKKTSKQLNKIHNLNYSIHYWKIIIGPWLLRFICIIYDRFKNLELVKKKNNIVYTKIANYSEEDYLFNNCGDYFFNLKDDKLNNVIYAHIIQLLKYSKIKYFKYKKNKTGIVRNKISIQKLVFIFWNKLFKLFSKEKDFFYYISYLPLKYYIALKIKFLEFPYFFYEPNKMQFKKDNTLRNWSIKNKKNKLCNILNILIPKHLPKIYLEGYQKSLNFINLLNWPKKPKFIFSSAAFLEDDIFKIYLAEQKRINKTKFISGQHGGGYFIYKNYFYLNHQSDISDYFITWGHRTNSSNKFIPIFNFYQKKINYLYNQNNGLLLIDDESSRFPSGVGYPIFYESNYTLLFKDRIIFLKNLKPSILKKVSIKLYPQDYKWANKEKYRSFNSSFKFVERDKKLLDILKNFKICVTNANFTGYLQTLNANFPTVLFFNKKVNLINSETVKVFKILKHAGILFDTPEEAANKINLVWNSIDLWWKSRKVQYAINYFCNKYSRRSDFQYKEIFKCFTSFEN